MLSVYYTNADELNTNFVESLQKSFPHKNIQILVKESDETDYLLSSKNDFDRLIAAKNDIENNFHLVTPNQEIFQNENH